MEGEIPKAKDVKVIAQTMVIKFDNRETRYLKTHLGQEAIDTYSGKKDSGKGKIFAGLYASTNMMLGATSVKIQEDGTVILNDGDIYTPEKLWNGSKECL